MGCIGPLFFLQTYAVWPQGDSSRFSSPLPKIYKCQGEKKKAIGQVSTKNS